MTSTPSSRPRCSPRAISCCSDVMRSDRPTFLWPRFRNPCPPAKHRPRFHPCRRQRRVRRTVPAPSEPYQRHTSQAVPPPRLPAAPALSPAPARLHARTPAPASPSPARSRYLPAELKRSVYLRDGGRCVFRAPDGTRCPSRDVEYHHIIPYARGGQHSLQNIALACKAHNQLQADIDYGRAHQERFRRPDRLTSAQLSPERAALQPNRDGYVGSEHEASASP